MKEVAKPLYFYRRYRTSNHDVSKRAYYHNRLLEMGIDVFKDKVYPHPCNHPILVRVERKVEDNQWAVYEFDYTTEHWEFIGNRVPMPMDVNEYRHFNYA